MVSKLWLILILLFQGFMSSPAKTILIEEDDGMKWPRHYPPLREPFMEESAMKRENRRRF